MLYVPHGANGETGLVLRIIREFGQLAPQIYVFVYAYFKITVGCINTYDALFLDDLHELRNIDSPTKTRQITHAHPPHASPLEGYWKVRRFRRSAESP